MRQALEATWTDTHIEGFTGSLTLSGIEKPEPCASCLLSRMVVPCTQGQV